MAFVVEDGTGLSTANSFVSVEEADAYFEDRDPDHEIYADWWDLTTEAKQAALVRGTQGLCTYLLGRWRGKKKSSTQALPWPRTDVEDEEGLEVSDEVVPVPVRQATCEVGFIEITQRYVQREVTRDDMIQTETTGPITTTYFKGAPSTTVYPHIDAMLRGLASTGGDQLELVVGLTEDEARGKPSDDPFDFPGYFNLVKNY